MAITVKFFAEFHEATGKREESIEGVNNIIFLLDELSAGLERSLRNDFTSLIHENSAKL